ncbi:hypothetical protein [Nereida ignava]|uniref:Histidine phosphotransferase ChpT C-terminal domain-containing protein n=1 Tax=Nereida ignava TaxID=282199 RepID=A0A0U1NI79_9RHOB|nr:hypothetical protein NIG5292_00425 [Nereida ignava]SFJ47442.1 Uncharacterized protein conserved in bacteria [Nereida ignava DSM 16309]
MTQEIQSTPLDLSALVGSRICHDLISPLGAIANGVELMALTGAEQTPEMLLIAESVEAAVTKVRPSDVHFFLTAQMRAEHQIALNIEVSDAEIKMTF